MTMWPLHDTYYSGLQKLHLHLKYIRMTVWQLHNTYYSCFQKIFFTIFRFIYMDVRLITCKLKFKCINFLSPDRASNQQTFTCVKFISTVIICIFFTVITAFVFLANQYKTLWMTPYCSCFILF
jgi:hypothetical protein